MKRRDLAGQAGVGHLIAVELWKCAIDLADHRIGGADRIHEESLGTHDNARWQWNPFVPAALTHREATEYVHSHIRSIAHAANDVIQEIRLGAPSQYSSDWYRWTTSSQDHRQPSSNDQIGTCRVHR